VDPPAAQLFPTPSWAQLLGLGRVRAQTPLAAPPGSKSVQHHEKEKRIGRGEQTNKQSPKNQSHNFVKFSFFIQREVLNSLLNQNKVINLTLSQISDFYFVLPFRNSI